MARLTELDLLNIFPLEKIEESKYTTTHNRTYIRLINNKPAEATVPALYPNLKEYRKELLAYENVPGKRLDGDTGNQKIDVDITPLPEEMPPLPKRFVAEDYVIGIDQGYEASLSINYDEEGEDIESHYNEIYKTILDGNYSYGYILNGYGKIVSINHTSIDPLSRKIIYGDKLTTEEITEVARDWVRDRLTVSEELEELDKLEELALINLCYEMIQEGL